MSGLTFVQQRTPTVTINLADYNPDATGATSSDTALTNALNALATLGGGELLIPLGAFDITGINQTSVNNITIRGMGRGSVLRMHASTTNNIIQLTSCSNWTIRDITLDCNCTNQTQGTNEDLQCGIHLVSCTFIQIRGIRTLNSFMSGIRLGTFAAGTGTCTDIAITNCEIYNNSANYVAGTSDPDQGIGIWNSQRVSVTNCNINNGGWAGICLTYSDYCTITGNTSYNNVYRIGGSTNGGHGVAIEGGHWNTISGNVCYSNNVNGIHMENDPQTSARYVQDCVISGNTCDGNINGIFAGHASRVSILGNTCYGNSQKGITISTNADTCIVEGNIAESNTQIGFWLNANDCVVLGNIAKANVQQGFLMQNTPTGNMFANNVAVGNTQAGFDLRGCVNCVITGNIADTNTSQGFIIKNDSAVAINSSFTGNIARNNSNEGIIFLNGTGWTISGNVASGNHGNAGLNLRGVQLSSITGNTIVNNNTQGIKLEDNSTTYCLYNIISGNNASDTQGGSHTQTYGINETGNSNYNQIFNNYLNNNVTAQLAKVGANTLTRLNNGYATESHGSASITSGNTTVTVTHGLATTPSLEQISITPQTSLGSAASYWVNGVTSTQFTINVNANPAQTVTFGWKADTGY